MNIHAIPVGAFEVNCWIISPAAQQAIVIDPGADAPRLAAYLDQAGCTVQGYLLTHGHMDHVSALAPLHRTHPAPIRIHPRDAAWAFSPSNQMPPYYDAPEAPPETSLHTDLTASSNNCLATISYDIIETPGHTPGSVCIHFPTGNALFTGDTLFAGSAGRTDFPGGNATDLKASLQRLLDLPPETRLFPGHGRPSTLAEEIRSNPFLQ